MSLEKKEVKVITLKRLKYYESCIIGQLIVNENMKFWTLEDKFRKLSKNCKEKVLHKTAISAGTYKIELVWSNRFGKIMPRIKNVPCFEGILIHSGNTEKDTSGCILVGKEIFLKTLSDSKIAFNEIFKYLEENKDKYEYLLKIDCVYS